MKLSSVLLLCLYLGVTLPASAAQDLVIWNGGITIDEREAAPKTGTKLSFFVAGGAYLSEIDVTLRNDAGREILHTVTDGPWLILNLPAGEYSVQAKRKNGDVQSLKIQVAGMGASTFGFMFPGE